ncbi:2-dehydro-3-deoxygalactonokinase [Pseudooceanicola aestuarii]|uniref:2-dehydro-3-deoxygalactonokinase n=1 Tax=Pseudooceanicola aestuarii TaxID=2697319 RepID=UPI0013D1E5A4|nr:2-dehydro-3-deoxygalactonokinase [Pseudooceanicola aestuarii]
MAWQGDIIGDGSVWGPGGRETRRAGVARIVVGDPSVLPDRIPAKLLPEALAGGNHLPPLTGMPADLRLRLLGFQTLNPHWDGVAIAPGPDRTVWATLSAGEVIHVQGALTGKLAHSLQCEGVTRPEGIEAALSRPERLAMLLDEARQPEVTLGALIGAEMAAAKSLWLGQQAVLIGSGPLRGAYLAAFQALYVPVTDTMEDAVTRAGFRALAGLLHAG